MKLKRIIVSVLVLTAMSMLALFAVGCGSGDNGDSGSTPENPTRPEYSDKINEIKSIKVTATSGEGYIVEYPSEVEKGETLTFRVDVFENYSAAEVKVNGTSVKGENGSYSTEVVGEKAEIEVTGVQRTHCSVQYLNVKGVTFSGKERIAVGESLEFSVSIDGNAVKTADFSVIANGVTVAEKGGKYKVDNLQSDLQISVEGIEYPTFSVSCTEGEGYKLKTNCSEVYKGDDLLVAIDLEPEYVLKSNPVIYANGNILPYDGNGCFVLKNVSEKVVLTVEGIEKIGKYVVRFENVEEEYPETEVIYGETVSDVSVPQWDGRTFKCWSVSGAPVTLENYAVTDDVTFVAVWNYNHKSSAATRLTAHNFTKEEVEEIGENLPEGFRVGYGSGRYSQNAEWEAFRVQDNKEGAEFSVTFPKFDFKKYGYAEFKFSTIWSTKTVYYNGVKLGSVSNGGNLNNYLEIFVSNGYIGCGTVKTPLEESVYDGTTSLKIDVDNGKGRHGVFSDFYTYEYDYSRYVNAIIAADETVTKDEADVLVKAYKEFKDFFTPYEKANYAYIQSKITTLKKMALPTELWSDGSFVSAFVNGAEKKANNENDAPGKTAAELGTSKRWTMTDITEMDLSFITTSLDSDEKAEYKIAFQSGSFPYTITVGGVEVLVANENLDVITITIHGRDNTLTISAKNQGITKTVKISENIANGSENLIVKVTKSADWGNLYVSHKVVLDVENA